MNKIKLIPRLFFITCLSVGLYSAHAGNDIAGSCLGKNYTAAIVPEAMSVAEMKQRFRCLVEADIKAIYFDLLTQYESIREEMSEQGDSENIKRLRIQYKAESNQALLAALKPHPRSIAIAQAALESAWGTSRFFREANNIFGIRPYHQNEPKIAAKKGTETKRYGSKNMPQSRLQLRTIISCLAEARVTRILEI